MRFATLGLFAAIALGTSACDAPRIVDCDPGVFARAGDDVWCVYNSGAGVRCPSDLPVEHTLPWGDRACATRLHETIPAELCQAAGECTDDAGSGG